MNTHPYQDEPEPTQVTLMTSRKSGKTRALIYHLLEQANERGIEVTIQQPLPTREQIADVMHDIIGDLDLNVVTRAEMDTATEKAADAVLALILGCCGKCPPTATGIDCTCAGNPRCKGDTNE